jgi:AcrR family transcriptional regulator
LATKRDKGATVPAVKQAAAAELRTEVQEFKRRRILEEARELFFAHGYEATTLDAIADALNVTKPFLYSYFRNKSEILNAICEIGITKSIEALDGALVTKLAPPEKLRLIVESVTTIIITNQKYIVVYTREEKNLEQKEAKYLIGLRRDFDQRFAKLLEEGNASGDFEIEDAALTAVSISGLITWVANWYRPSRHSQIDVVSHTIRLVERMVSKRPRR